MRRTFLFFTVLLASCGAVLAGHASGPSSSDGRHWGGRHVARGDTVWVTNRDQGTLAVFEAATGETVTPIPITVGRGAHDLVVSRRAGKAYVMNETDNNVSVLSASTLDHLGTIPLGPKPHHTKSSRDGRTVYVGLFDTNRIATIDTELDSPIPREYISSDQPGHKAHAPRPSRDGRVIFVPHEVGNLVTAIDAETEDILLSVAPGTAPSEVLPTRNGRLLYVSMRGEGKVKVIDLAQRAVSGEVSVGTQPESLILTNHERTLIVSMRGTPAQLAFVKTRSLTLMETLTIGGPGTFGDLAIKSPDGRYVYATFDSGPTGQGGVVVVDVRRRTVVDTWEYPGLGRPHGIAYSTTRLRDE